MRSLSLVDVTLTRDDLYAKMNFRDKLEFVRQLCRLGVSGIELPPVTGGKADFLFIRSVAAVLEDTALSVPVSLDLAGLDDLTDAMKEIRSWTLCVSAPVSSVQMEYIGHKKPEVMKNAIVAAIRACREKCPDVEFIAEDATRSDRAFLLSLLPEVIAAGAGSVTLRDDSGHLLPAEFGAFIRDLYEAVPALAEIRLGVRCTNEMQLADACAVEAVAAGAQIIKTVSSGYAETRLDHVMKILDIRKKTLDAACGFRMEECSRVMDTVKSLTVPREKEQVLPTVRPDSDPEHEQLLSSGASRDDVRGAVIRLGYDLSDQDFEKVWSAFCHASGKKNGVTLRELDAVIAAEAMQVEPTYRIISYVINTGNVISSTAHMKLECRGRVLEGISVGDGAIDAAFLAIEKTIGRHFELDDFQIRAISEGREAMGETVVKLRNDGKLYSGRGISTDIVGSGVMAYINALNKIVFEEEEA